MNPKHKPKSMKVMKRNPSIKARGPHKVKSVLVVAAQTVIAITTAAVRQAASATIIG